MRTTFSFAILYYFDPICSIVQGATTAFGPLLRLWWVDAPTWIKLISRIKSFLYRLISHFSKIEVGLAVLKNSKGRTVFTSYFM